MAILYIPPIPLYAYLGKGKLNPVVILKEAKWMTNGC